MRRREGEVRIDWVQIIWGIVGHDEAFELKALNMEVTGLAGEG